MAVHSAPPSTARTLARPRGGQGSASRACTYQRPSIRRCERRVSGSGGTVGMRRSRRRGVGRGDPGQDLLAVRHHLERRCVRSDRPRPASATAAPCGPAAARRAPHPAAARCAGPCHPRASATLGSSSDGPAWGGHRAGHRRRGSRHIRRVRAGVIASNPRSRSPRGVATTPATSASTTEPRGHARSVDLGDGERADPPRRDQLRERRRRRGEHERVRAE